MAPERILIDLFIDQCLANPRAASITENWRVEPKIIRKILIGHFREMGIFFVEASHAQVVTKSVLLQLKNSAEINLLVKKAQKDEDFKKNSRHAV